MGTFIVEGERELRGTVSVSGSKNAALPIIFATLLTHGVSRISNLPDIEDVNVALELIAEYGAVISRRGHLTVINTENLNYVIPSTALTERIRASTYLLGASLGRFGRACLGSFGGCNFSHRPIDMHLRAAEAYGAERLGDVLEAQAQNPFTIRFPKRSVGATVNSLLLASSVAGESRISGAAGEPHINTLIEFLRSAGAHIDTAEETLTIRGGELHGGEVTIPGDMIEAGTYLALSLLNDGSVGVEGAEAPELSGFLFPFISSGASLVRRGGTLLLRGRLRSRTDITTLPYPGFPTDLQPIAAPVLGCFLGGSITDTVWEGRFGYLAELQKMGLSSAVEKNLAEIYPSRLHSSSVRALDLRGGAACLLAALTARGESRVESGELLFRGYERLCEKLLLLGAKIRYVS